MVFFSFIGFDAVTTMASEVENPTRNIPLGICITLAVACFFYVLG